MACRRNGAGPVSAPAVDRRPRRRAGMLSGPTSARPAFGPATAGARL